MNGYNYDAQLMAMVVAAAQNALTLAQRYQCAYAVISDYNGMDHKMFVYLMAYSTVVRESVEAIVYPDGTITYAWEA